MADDALRVLGELSDRPFARSRLVECRGERFLHKEFRLPGVSPWFPGASRWLMRHELANCRRLDGAPGVAAQARPHAGGGLLRAWVEGEDVLRRKREGRPLPDGFFDELAAIVAEVHRRGVAYNDLEHKDNVLVDPDGHPVLIDFQISLRTYRGPGAWLRRASEKLVSALQEQDIRYLYKMKRRLRPDLLTPDEEALVRERNSLSRAYLPFWRVLHGLKRRWIPKGSQALRPQRRRSS